MSQTKKTKITSLLPTRGKWQTKGKWLIFSATMSGNLILGQLLKCLSHYGVCISVACRLPRCTYVQWAVSVRFVLGLPPILRLPFATLLHLPTNRYKLWASRPEKSCSNRPSSQTDSICRCSDAFGFTEDNANAFYSRWSLLIKRTWKK